MLGMFNNMELCIDFRDIYISVEHIVQGFLNYLST